MIITPIKKIVVNGVHITWQTKYNSIKNKPELVKIAYRLFRHGHYPTVVNLVLNQLFENFTLEIIQSKHNKFKRLKHEKPHLFDCIGTPEYIEYVKTTLLVYFN